MVKKKQVMDINHLGFYNFFNLFLKNRNLFLKNIYLYINVYNKENNE